MLDNVDSKRRAGEVDLLLGRTSDADNRFAEAKINYTDLANKVYANPDPNATVERQLLEVGLMASNVPYLLRLLVEASRDTTEGGIQLGQLEGALNRYLDRLDQFCKQPDAQFLDELLLASAELNQQSADVCEPRTSISSTLGLP